MSKSKKDVSGMKVNDFLELKRKIDETKQKHSKAVGSRDTMLQRLKADYDCNSLEEAEEMLRGLQEKKTKLQKLHASRLKVFEEKWADKLTDLD